MTNSTRQAGGAGGEAEQSVDGWPAAQGAATGDAQGEFRVQAPTDALGDLDGQPASDAEQGQRGPETTGLVRCEQELAVISRQLGDSNAVGDDVAELPVKLVLLQQRGEKRRAAGRGRVDQADPTYSGRAPGGPFRELRPMRGLEERRELVRIEIGRRDEGALFTIANEFAIRHQRRGQQGDYDPAFLDWMFWWYLATLELTSRILDRDAAAQPVGAPTTP